MLTSSVRAVRIPFTSIVITLTEYCTEKQVTLTDIISDELDNKLLELDHEILYNRDYMVRSSLGDRFSSDYRDYVLEYEQRINDMIKEYEDIMTWTLTRI